MRGISVDQSVIDQIFSKKVSESKVETKPETKETKKVQESEEVEAEVHTCPLCESELAEPLSEEKISEHVDWMLGVLNENFDIDGADSLDEETEEEENTEEDSDEEGK